MKLRVGTFNLFQFCSPPFSFYTKKEKFTPEEWNEKIAWCKNQLNLMNCDIVGFQEVFSNDELKNLCLEVGFKYFEVVDFAKVDKKNEKVYISTTVAIASKFPIITMEKIFTKSFKFARTPIKAIISLPNEKNLTVYVTHLKSNRENEFEYIFTKNDTLDDKLKKVEVALKDNYSLSLKQRLNEATALYKDIKSNKNPTILMCDLNDKEFSITIDVLTNKRFYNRNLKKDDYLLFDAYYLFKPKIYNPHPEFKGVKRTPTSYFAGKGNILDYIFVSKELQKITSYEILDKHLQKNHNGSLKQSDHAQVVCEIEF
ncbi:endonuclease/exonuclease/phosphatase family protein [Aliarcobacter butzleri]|uniref:endonuclease/exonuclease/phosphatase family protein n=1 Tax=Aliarcobacter butzleri TaxID=28197 RepID=UPI001EDEB578|nr:endonuclease/exonuclease/phosphatase family protein [Aliarcobacter butzleri]MCG3668737.1 endonuclease/exonuclease/phosphatase family protein [Aliarcobacter butzleri]MDN5067381.1 endonuclease/exonuclease/phosphatase family protein [Aliarcobacter butzleri]